MRVVFLLVVLLQAAGALRGTNGLRYEHRRTEEPQSVHILELDPRQVRIVAVRAMNEGVGRETVSSIAQRTSARSAVNAGFFTIGGRYDGEPDGILKIRRDWFSDATVPRGAIAWREDGSEALIGQPTISWVLSLEGKRHAIDGINRPRAAAERILYTWAFHRSTLTDPLGTEVMVERGRVRAVHTGGDASIPTDGFVYSVGPDAVFPAGSFRRGQRAQLSYDFRLLGDGVAGRHGWEKMDFIVGGLGVLVRSGQVVTDHADQKVRQGFITDRHPRTAVGILSDGRWVFAVVDGRQPQLSRGMTLAELAEFMKSLGCRDALNLDGGGSSTFLHEGRVLNSPSDGRERPVSDAIVILPR